MNFGLIIRTPFMIINAAQLIYTNIEKEQSPQGMGDYFSDLLTTILGLFLGSNCTRPAIAGLT